MNKILIVDDEENIREVLSGILEDEGYTVDSAKDGLEGLSKAEDGNYDLVILDVWLPGMGGMEVLDKLKTSRTDLEVVVISGHGNIDMAVKAVKKGAFDFLEKPLSLDKVVTVVKNALALEKLRKENRELKESLFIEDRMTGSGPEMDKIWKIIEQVSASDVSVMILGENGTGKELVAREIHRRSSRKDFPFVEVNCASIPDTLIESELFGHEKGSFTGAVAGRRGKFEIADRGTLFLDEVADMSLNAQAKVLRAIQEMRFERVGSEKSTQVNVRILAATNRDIFNEVRTGRFREDLYFRLNVIPINLPPLRERKSDISDLVEYFLKKYNKNEKSISPEGIALMREYRWPGNIRELKNFIQRISVMTDEIVVSAETTAFYLGEPDHVVPSNEKTAAEAHIGGIDAELNLNDAKELFERKFLVNKLEKNSYNITRTAQELGMYPGNLHQKLKKLGINLK
ncbi:MAG: sigma-54-dependent Fis family transcriptional regulator [Spirochaetales bacterium]|nr:sigma-54-dependent Fis family transcriptional regulator [Spirochaetales bacterium]